MYVCQEMLGISQCGNPHVRYLLFFGCTAIEEHANAKDLESENPYSRD
jgi:hypothetical protein